MKLFHFLKNNIKKYLLFGIATFVPFYITVIVLLKIVTFFDNIIKDIMKIFDLPPIVNKFFAYPGVGALLCLVFLILIGFLSRQYFGNTLMHVVEKVFTLFPISKQVYLSVKKMTGSFIKNEEQKYKRVVLVPFPHRDVYAIGFLTGETTSNVDGKKSYYVYVPTAINPTSGFLISIDKSLILESDLSVEDAFSLILSGGMAASKISESR